MAKYLVFFITLLGVLNPALSESFSDIFNITKEGFWKDQWERLRASTSVAIFDTNIGKIAGIQSSYEYLVEPAYVKGLHQRQDVWVANINSDTGRLRLTDGKPFGLSGSLNARVTFSRLFNTKGAALRSIPYWLDRIPWNAEGVATSLNVGDAVRMETSLDLSGNIGSSWGPNSFNLGVSLGQSRGLRFLTDIYRMKNNRLRIRLIGQRDDGTNSGGLSLNPFSQLNLGSAIAERWLGRFIHCTAAGGSITRSNFDDPPVDTQMIDYMINLNSAEGRDAYNKIMSNITKLIFVEILNLKLIFENRTAYSDYMKWRLSQVVSRAEEVVKEDAGISVESRRVDRIFKGRTQSANSGFSLHTDCFRFWDASYSNGGSSTLVENYDRFEKISHELFDSTLISVEKAALFYFIEKKTRSSMSSLIEASPSFEPTRFSDMDISVDYTDKVFSDEKYRALKNHLKFILPPGTYSQIDWSKMDAIPGAKNNASYRYDIILHDEAIDALPALNEERLDELLSLYIKNHPERESLPYVYTSNLSGINDAPGSQDPMTKFSDDINFIKKQLAIFLYRDITGFADLGAFHKERRTALNKLRMNLLFQNIGPGFVISLLPKDKVDSLMSFRLHLNTEEASVIFNNNGSGLSSTFSAVEYILNLINYRGFDLRLQVDATGALRPSRTQQDNNVPPNANL